MKAKKLRVGATVVVLALILSGISYIFWQNELKYRLPTPVPSRYAPPATGEVIDLKGKLATPVGKPAFIHFFNPDCPCSRFNMPHFKSLVRKYGDKVAFSVVVLDKEKKHNREEVRERFDLEMPISFDESIADSCGVYSTPQAVLLDADRRLYYRGNYNKSRYCTDAQTNYAQMAIDSFLMQQRKPVFSQYALTAYGCELPNCTK